MLVSTDPESFGGVCDARFHSGDSFLVKLHLRPDDSGSLTCSRLTSSPDLQLGDRQRVTTGVLAVLQGDIFLHGCILSALSVNAPHDTSA